VAPNLFSAGGTLELGTHAEFIPSGQFTIRAFAAVEFPKLFEQAEASVTSLLAKPTFWEKATILHAEFHRPPEKFCPDATRATITM
jgi:hypothetical protein